MSLDSWKVFLEVGALVLGVLAAIFAAGAWFVGRKIERNTHELKMPRHLSDEATATLLSSLRVASTKPKVSVTYVPGSPEAARFSAELETVIRQAGWPSGHRSGIVMPKDSVTGIFVMVRDVFNEKNPIFIAGDRLVSALKKVGVSHVCGVWGPDTPTDELEMLVGFKPDSAP